MRGLPEAGKCKLVLHSKHANDDDECARYNEVDVAINTELKVEQQVKNRPCEACSGINFFSEDNRCFIRERVADHATHHCGEHSHDSCDLRTDAKAQCFLHSENSEEGNTKCVEQEECALETQQPGEKHECYEDAGQDRVEEVDVTNPHQRVTPERDVAQTSASDCCQETGEAGSEPVMVTVVDCHRSGDGEEERSEKLKEILKLHVSKFQERYCNNMSEPSCQKAGDDQTQSGKLPEP